MSWNVISNSSLVRVNSFNYKITADDSCQSKENFAPELLEYMNNIFNTLDVSQSGYTTVDELDKYWKSGDQGYDLYLKSRFGISSENVVGCMRQISPSNGMFNFRRFIRGMKMAVSRAKHESLQKLSNGTLQPCERMNFSDNHHHAARPPKYERRSAGKFAERSSSTNDKAEQNSPKDFKRACRDKQNSIFVNTKQFQSNNHASKRSIRTVFANGSDTGGNESSLDVNSFLSLSDTIDYTKFADRSSQNHGYVAGNAMTKKCPEDFVSSRASSMLRDFPKSIEISDYRGFRNTGLHKLIDQVSEKIRMMQKCMESTENAREWYMKKISFLQQNRMELRRMVFMGKSNEEMDFQVEKMKTSWGSLRYDEVKRYVGTLSYYHDHLQGNASKQEVENEQGSSLSSPKDSTTTLILEKMVEGQSRQIKQLEDEKAALVKDLFLMKGKLEQSADKPVDQIVPF